MRRDEIVGKFMGSYRVREGRESELSKDEIRRYLKSKVSLELVVRADGTFVHMTVVSGAWTLEGDLARFQPTAFGRQTADEMHREADNAGRVFTLAFLFAPFVLRWDGEAFVTPDPDSLIYTEYRRMLG